MKLADAFVWMPVGTAPFRIGKIIAAIDCYLAQRLPPFTDALSRYRLKE